MMSDSVSASEIMRFAAKAKSQINSLYSFAHFANCTSDLSAGTCRRLPMMGDPLGPGGSGYFDFEPCKLYIHNPATSNIIPPPKAAKPQLPLRLRRASGNEFMMSVCNYSFFLTDPYLKPVPELCHSILELYICISHECVTYGDIRGHCKHLPLYVTR